MLYTTHTNTQSLRDSLWKTKDEAAEEVKLQQTKLKEAYQKSEVSIIWEFIDCMYWKKLK